MNLYRGLSASAAVLFATIAAVASAQIDELSLDLDHPAIAYRLRSADDPVARLSRRLQTRETQLRFEPRGGYLRSLLQELDVPVESQIALFSKTSLQSNLIQPANPRIIFFNDAVAVAWMRGGFIEIAAQDPAQGTHFYLLAQAPDATPQLQRDSRCLRCHYSAAAGGVPAVFARSIPSAFNGEPLPWLGNATVSHETPIAERWGGWYVTGSAGPLVHLGNLFITDARAAAVPAWTPQRAFTSIPDRVPPDATLTPHSDIVALLVFDHQARMMNLLTRVGWMARIEAHDGRGLSPAVRREIEALVAYMVFENEAPLAEIRGTSGFAERFSSTGPRDSKGRSLRELDLRTRLLRHRCSYMIYSDAFNALPGEVRDLIYRALKQRLGNADGAATLEILRETKTDLPAGF